MESYIDLHIHTNNSDGQFSTNEIIDNAIKNDTNFIAISDHDTIKGLSDFHENLKEGMIGIDGVEFSSYITFNNHKVKLHILGYGFDQYNREISKLLDEMKEKRMKAHLDLLNMLKQQLLTLPEQSISKLDLERYCWFDRELIKCMKAEKYPIEVVDYYQQYFKNNRFSYGEDYDLDVNRVIDGIHSSGGFVVLAHPMAYNINRLQMTKIILELYKLGIDGIEIYQSDCNLDDSLYLKQLSEKLNLLWSVGSDFHRLVNSDGRLIGKGINNNLCITETSLTNKILDKKMYFKGGK